LAAILGVASLLIYTFGMYLSYHVLCGSQYYQAGNCYQPNYKNWSPNSLYSEPVSGQLTLTQEIIPECDGMTELRVWVNSTRADPNTTTNFILRDTQQDRDAVNLETLNSNLPKGGWYSLNFPPDWKSNGKLYIFTIRGNGTNASGPGIAYTLKPEYLTGKLYENDQPIENDMVFQTGCIAGIGKIRQTNIP
jgi:hypothetical protein